jgi:hypothetical protein
MSSLLDSRLHGNDNIEALNTGFAGMVGKRVVHQLEFGERRAKPTRDKPPKNNSPLPLMRREGVGDG